ncbi:MAG: hypothetical protein ABL974_22175 [Prosthecobacter sp.]
MLPRWLLILGLLSTATAQDESPFAKAERDRAAAVQRALDRAKQPTLRPIQEGNPMVKGQQAREAALQRAFDRGQRTALPAAEERESIGKLEGVPKGAKRSEDGKVVDQGPPAAAVYNRVMETARYFKHYGDVNLRNANDTFTDSSEVAEKMSKEAHGLYPDLDKSQSAFALRYAAINRWVDSRQPPLVKDARRVLLVAHMVSLELTGQVRPDKFNLGQIPAMHFLGQLPPAFIKRSNFEIIVQGDVALLPDGLRGTVIRGGGVKPDIVQWLDAEGAHIIRFPAEKSGRVTLFQTFDCDYRRIETLDDDFRLLVSHYRLRASP